MTQKPSKTNEIERLFKLAFEINSELAPAKMTLRYLTENVYAGKDTAKYKTEVTRLQLLVFGTISFHSELIRKATRLVHEEHFNQGKGN